MTEQTRPSSKREAKRPQKAQRAGQPGWVDGLRQLYDASVNEPLPPSFEELLRKLDQPDNQEA